MLLLLMAEYLAVFDGLFDNVGDECFSDVDDRYNDDIFEYHTGIKLKLTDGEFYISVQMSMENHTE